MVMMIMNGVEFNVVSKINNNELEASTPFTYRGREFYLNKLEYGTEVKKTVHSISEKRMFGSTMNVDKTTNQYLSLFTYDMMSNKTQYKMAVQEMVFTIEE